MTGTERPYLSVVLPCQNERENLADLLPRIAEVLADHRLSSEVLVIDDNSTDGTAGLVEQLARSYPVLHVVPRTDGLPGVGRTLRAGFHAARGDVIITMDGDGSHDPADIPRLLAAIDGGADLTIGSRYGNWRGDRYMSLSRRAISGAYSTAARLLLGTPLSDLTSGYRAIRRSALEAVAPRSDGFEIHAEIHLRAMGEGLSVTQTPIVYLSREKGSSKLRYFRVGVPYATQLLRAALGRLKRAVKPPRQLKAGH